jgi:hypothetical protein
MRRAPAKKISRMRTQILAWLRSAPTSTSAAERVCERSRVWMISTYLPQAGE